jgi:hypothetical protein
VIRRCVGDSRQGLKSSISNTKMVGGPGFEPGASMHRSDSNQMAFAPLARVDSLLEA